MIQDVCMGTSRLSTHELHIEERCAECGKVFMRSSEHAYKRIVRDRQRMYCSWTCYRVEGRKKEAQEREAFERSCSVTERKKETDKAYRKRKQACTVEAGLFKSPADAQARVEKANQKIKHYSAAFLNAPKGSTAQRSARRLLKRWEHERDDALGWIEDQGG